MIHRFRSRGSDEPSASRSGLSEPEAGTPMNSTGTRITGPTIQESAIEKDFDSSYDDSFVLRTKKTATVNESGFASAQTFSFDETESVFEHAEGFKRLLDQNAKKRENFLDDDIFHFHILERKVKQELKKASAQRAPTEKVNYRIL